MSHFSVADFLESGKKSLADKNFYSALSVALMLPSMCSRIEYQNDEKYWNLKNGTKHWRDKPAYMDFCDKYFSQDGWLKSCLGSDVTTVLYELRCDIIHAANADIYDKECPIWLSYGKGVTATTLAKDRIVSIEGICETIFSSVDNWIQNFKISSNHRTFIFANTAEDNLLYNRLCEKERTTHLEEMFQKEHEKRSVQVNKSNKKEQN